MKITVVIPALNEEKGIVNVLNDIPDYVHEVIVVDNGSTDNTALVAQEHGATVIKEERKGYGRACLTGIAAIRQCTILVILDADYSDHPDEMDLLIGPIKKGDADFVIGSRILGKREKGALLPQAYFGNKLASFLISLLFGRSYSDMGPFRAVDFEKFKSLEMRDNNYGWNVEMLIKAIKNKLQIVEVPIQYRKRIGASKISGTVSGTITAGMKIIYTIIKYRFTT